MSAFEIREVDGQGRGMIATRDIPVGECIVEEEPLLKSSVRVWPVDSVITVIFVGMLRTAWIYLGPSSLGWLNWILFAIAAYFATFRISPAVFKIYEHAMIRRAFQFLSAESHEAYLDLHCPTVVVDPIIGRFSNNALSSGDGGAVYATICKINHSCVPNARPSWNSDAHKQCVHAISPIRSGEQVMIPYIDLLQPCEQRQAQLSKLYEFRCSCSACSDPSVSDQRRLSCETIGRRIENAKSTKLEEALRDTQRLVDTLNAEFGPFNCLADGACWLGYQTAMDLNADKLAQNWAAKTHRLRMTTLGHSHPETLKAQSAMQELELANKAP